jgi:hypothetical protein
MTRQEMFDTAAKHLLTQRTRSIGNDNYCNYRGQQGRMCAIGPMIPDEKYSPDLEGLVVGTGVVWNAMGLDSDDPDNLKTLARALQCIHDTLAPTAWPYKLLDLALNFNLDTDMVRHCADAMIWEDPRFSQYNSKVQEP